MEAKGAFQNEGIGCFTTLQRSQVEVDLGLQLRGKSLGQTLKGGLTFLPISLSKCYGQPNLWAEKSRPLDITGKNYNIPLRKTFSTTTGSLELVKDLEWFLDKWNVVNFSDFFGRYYMSCSFLFVYFGLPVRSSAVVDLIPTAQNTWAHLQPKKQYSSDQK